MSKWRKLAQERVKFGWFWSLPKRRCYITTINELSNASSKFRKLKKSHLTWKDIGKNFELYTIMYYYLAENIDRNHFYPYPFRHENKSSFLNIVQLWLYFCHYTMTLIASQISLMYNFPSSTRINLSPYFCLIIKSHFKLIHCIKLNYTVYIIVL